MNNDDYDRGRYEYFKSRMSDGEQEALGRPRWFKRDGYLSETVLIKNLARKKLEKAAYGLRLAIANINDLETARELNLILEEITE